MQYVHVQMDMGLGAYFDTDVILDRDPGPGTGPPV